MTSSRIVITQSGVAGGPGISRNDLALGVLVSLSNADNAGVRSWRWHLLDKPATSNAVLSNPISAVASFTPDVEGSYFVELIVDQGGVGQVDRAIAAVQEDFGGQLFRFPAAGEADEANWNISGTPNTRGWQPDVTSILRRSLTLATGAATGDFLTLQVDGNANIDGTLTVGGVEVPGGLGWASVLALSRFSGTGNNPAISNTASLEFHDATVKRAEFDFASEDLRLRVWDTDGSTLRGTLTIDAALASTLTWDGSLQVSPGGTAGFRVQTNLVYCQGGSAALRVGDGTGAPNLILRKADASNGAIRFEVGSNLRSRIIVGSSEDLSFEHYDVTPTLQHTTTYRNSTGNWEFPSDVDLVSASPQLTVGDGTGAGLVLVDADGSTTQTFFDARHAGVRQWAWRVTSSGAFLFTNTAGENPFSVVQNGNATFGFNANVNGALSVGDSASNAELILNSAAANFCDIAFRTDGVTRHTIRQEPDHDLVFWHRDASQVVTFATTYSASDGSWSFPDDVTVGGNITTGDAATSGRLIVDGPAATFFDVLLVRQGGVSKARLAITSAGDFQFREGGGAAIMTLFQGTSVIDVPTWDLDVGGRVSVNNDASASANSGADDIVLGTTAVSQGIGISIMAAAAATGRQWYNFGNESSTLDAGLGYQPSSSSIYLRWGSSDRIQGNGGSLFPVSDGGVTQGSVGLSFGGFYGAFLDAGRGAGTGGRTATVKGGTPTDGNGGAVAITGTAGGGTDRNGGGVSVTAGAATGSGTGGNITVQPGSSPSGAAGRIDLNDADGTQIVQVDSAGVDVSGDLDLSSASPQLTVGDGTGAGLVLVDADGSATQTFFDARHTGVRQWAWRVTSSGTFLLTNTAGENWFSVVQSGTVTLGGGLTVSGAAVTLDGPSLDFRVGSAASSSTFRAIKPDAGSWSRIFSVDGIAAANRRWVETFGSDESLTFNRWSGGAQVDTPLTLNASDGRVHVDTALQIGPTAVLYDSGGDFFIEAPTLGVFVESQGGTWEFDAGGDLIAPGGSTWTSTVVSSATGSAAFRASGASPTFLFGSGVGTPQIYLAKSDAGAANLWWMVDGTGDAQRRWLLQVDANEDWKLNRRDAAGASVDNPITVSWTSGEVFMESRLTLENINALNLSHASPVVTAGDATGTGGQFAYRKADASTFQWADVRSGGSSSTDRTWVVGFQGTSQDLRYDRYDGSTGALLDSPLRIDWGTGDIFAANDLYTSGLGAFGASAIPAGKSISLYVEGGAGRVTAASVSTDATNKTARFGVSHYTNAEEVVDAIIATCTSSTNSVSVGGSSIANAPTQFSVYTSANNTTVTGTERLRVDNNGLVQTLNGSDLSVDGDALTLHAAGSGSPNFFVNKVASGFATQTWRTAAGADTAGDKRFLFDTDESLKIQSFSGAWGTLVEFTAVDTISVAVSATFTSEAVFEQDAFFASILPSSPGTSNIGGASERFDVWADALDVNTLTLQSVSAPATPAANDTVIYSHDSDGRAKLKDSDGSIKILGLMPPIQFGPDDVARDFEGNIVADGTDPSAIYVSEWTTADRQALEFQNTASMGASWNKFLPETYSGKGLRIRLMLAGDTGSATTATFEAAFERVRTGDPADTSSFAATVSANVTMAAAADDFVECTISLSNAQIDGLSAGDFFRLHIRRPTGDTYAGDVRMWMGVIEEAV